MTALARERHAQIVHGLQRGKMLVPEDASLQCKRLPIECLGFLQLAPLLQHITEIVHGIQRVRVAVTKNAAPGCQRLTKQCLGLRVLSLTTEQQAKAVHRG